MRDWAELSSIGTQWGRRRAWLNGGTVRQLDPSKGMGQGPCMAADPLGTAV